ncbi:MAG: glycoside hydrolase family 30 protein [Bacteroidaceae bacterium]|nr:glycoside hydrolase family 30 protein [Bacteroidaceae bacterium]
MKRFTVALLALAGVMTACQQTPQVVEWVSTSYEHPWQINKLNVTSDEVPSPVIVIDTQKTRQTVEGFGTCFNELGWTSLNVLTQQEINGILHELFEPGKGANLTMGRMPLGANDFSLDFYSYDETDDDFDLKDFSIDHDRQTLLPFVKSALAINANIKLFASPWSPPQWMKVNHHYACNSTAAMVKAMEQRLAQLPDSVRHRMGGNSGITGMMSVDNGLAIDKVVREGEDAFIQDPRYLDAYARYFGKFIDAYRAEGVDFKTVMPQNEFNSDQLFPACVWKPESLANFIGNYLGPEMEKRGVEVFYGTIERANLELSHTILNNPAARKYIKGMGFQWAGKDALPTLHQEYPELACYQTEQECGNGKNDWAGAMHSWELMKHYFMYGVQAYFYWNTSLLEGGVSRWGWSQNSLVTVDKDAKTFRYTPEFYILKHASHYVMPGAKVAEIAGTYDDALSFVNPDGSVVVLVGNQSDAEQIITLQLNGVNQVVTMAPNTLNTVVLK